VALAWYSSQAASVVGRTKWVQSRHLCPPGKMGALAAALHLIAYSLRFATLHFGFWQQVSSDVRCLPLSIIRFANELPILSN